MKKPWLALCAVVLALSEVLIALYCIVDVPGLALAASPQQAPSVTEVNPSTAPNDLDTTVVITGTDFAAVPTVTLGTTRLDEVGWVSAQRLTATVPWGLITGTYTLNVTNPGGESGNLVDAFTVTQGIGVWTTNGPYGGNVAQITLHPGTSTTVYAQGWDVGLFVSDDAAAHWEMAMRLPRWHVDLTFDAQDTDVIYVGDEHTLHRTMDGTQTWEKISIRPDWWEHTPAAHPSLPGVVFAAVGSYMNPGQDGGVFRSDDYGDSWITLTVGLTDTHFTSLAIHPVLTQTMVAGTVSGNLFYSLDGGQIWNWTARLTDTVASIYFNPFEPLQAWATTGATTGSDDILGLQTLYKSEDLLSWTVVTVDATLSDGNRFGWDMDFISDTIWATTNGTYSSTDNGVTWTRLSDGPCHPGLWLAVNRDDPSQMYSGNELGVCMSDDGGATWQESNTGLAALIPGQMVVSPLDPETIYVRSPGLDLAKSENGGQGWRVLDIGLGSSPQIGLAVDPFIPNRVYVSDKLSDDGGETWQAMTFTLPISWSGWSSEISVFAPHPAIPGRILSGLDVADGQSDLGLLYGSDDYGEHWDYLGPTQPISWVTHIAYDAENPDLVYAATWFSGLWKSTDGGQTWSATPRPGGETEIPWMFTHPDTPNTVYAFTRQPSHGAFQMFISHDAGETWTAMPDGGANPFYFAPTQPASLYTACGAGNLALCRSWDGGYTWETVNEMQQEISSLAGGSDGERLVIYVGTKGGSVSSVPGMQASTAGPVGDIPGRGSIMGGGVYRFTSLVGGHRVYLPLVLRE